MPTFVVTTEVTAKVTITREIEAASERDAENMAASKQFLRDNLPEDFQVEPCYCETDVAAEAATAECPRCYKEHLLPCEKPSSAAVASRYMCAPDGALTFCRCGSLAGSLHLIDRESGICVPAPWWYEDAEYCPECGAAILATEGAAA